MAVTPESETEQASTQPYRVDPSQPVLAAPEDYPRGINVGLRSWLKCQAIRNQESFSSSTECFLHTVKRGKTPVLSADQARQLLDSIEVTELSGLRDRALIGVMVYSFARVSAATTLRTEDYFEHGKRAWLGLHEKTGKRHEVPSHHNLADYGRLDRRGRHPRRQERTALLGDS